MSLGGTNLISVTAGTMVRTSCVFTNLTTNELESPGVVQAGYQLDDNTPVSVTYPTDITEDETGLFHWDIDTTGFADPQQVVIMVLYWQGSDGLDVSSDPVVVRIVGPPFAL